jgi:signal transduction histidine kinase/phage shock protein PspC (stress-responsive transcriptional regulator)
MRRSGGIPPDAQRKGKREHIGACSPPPGPGTLFTRSTSNRVLTGVAGGLAERAGFEPMLLRLAFVVLTVGGGIGVVLYLLCWLLAAVRDTRPGAPAPDRSRWVPALLLVPFGLVYLWLTLSDTYGLGWFAVSGRHLVAVAGLCLAVFGVVRTVARSWVFPGSKGPGRADVWRLLGWTAAGVAAGWLLYQWAERTYLDELEALVASGLDEVTMTMILGETPDAAARMGLPLLLTGAAGTAAAFLLPLRPAPVHADPGSDWARAVPRPAAATSRAGQGRLVALLVLVGSGLLLAKHTGLWFSDPLAWLVALAGLGSAAGLLLNPARFQAPRLRVVSVLLLVVRVLVATALTAPGVLLFLTDGGVISGQATLAMIAALAAMALVFGPWVAQLVRQLGVERRSRIRSEERAELAAHLHDSVLHTLALLQRADVPHELRALARGQERELRAWLNGEPSTRDEPGTLRGAVAAIAGRVEQLGTITVESVVVGDAPLDERVRAVVGACSEAAVNAARHSGAPEVSVYVEVEPDQINGFVRDRGRGFDPGAVSNNGRRGLEESVKGRVRRHGGRATVMSSPGLGTEVHVHMPWSAA